MSLIQSGKPLVLGVVFFACSWFFCSMAHAMCEGEDIDESGVVYNKGSLKIKAIHIADANEDAFSLCDDERIDGRITKTEGEYPLIWVWVKSIRGKKRTTAFPICFNRFSMAMIRSHELRSFLVVGEKVQTHIKRCGSGGLPYSIYIKSHP